MKIFQKIKYAITKDSVLEKAEQTLQRVDSLILASGNIIDPDNLHKDLEVGHSFNFGYDNFEDVRSIYEGVIDGWYTHSVVMDSGARIGSHYHLKGNREVWKITKGKIAFFWGEKLENKHVLTAPGSFEIPAKNKHAITAFAQSNVKGMIYIEKIK